MIVQELAHPSLLINHEIFDIHQLKEGDHIYAWRTRSELYSHHGIYTAIDRVVHFIGPKAKGPVKACKKCGYKRKMHGGVIETCLDCFRSGSYVLYVYRYGMSMRDLQLSSHVLCQTCTIKESKPASEVVKTAKEKLEVGFGTYNLISNNCEDFATFCKTGTSFCQQAYRR
ncbi:hypothetical protein SADUNF_Sadunf05G0033700 [Salix dunnii]|uniref:LRAT domain-containing protein n=1 Tax=Salix dunnii TaxID=1413687 RepID=A0A835K288_9ROSI|nr:hypothetical protein SADUNF_Sadunf05G0033700 [Salix dunnii]